MSSIEEYIRIRQQCQDPAQEQYESIRELLFDEELTATERSRQTGYDPRTIRKRLDRFLKEGMKGLVEDAQPHRDEVPAKIREYILNLLRLYSGFGYKELSRIVYKKFETLIHWRKIKKIVTSHKAQGLQPILAYHQHEEAYSARVQIIKLYSDGWSPTSISRYMKVSRRHVYRLLERFAEGAFTGLLERSRAPNNPHQKVTFKTIAMIYHIQREWPTAGEFRVWGILKQRLEAEGLSELLVSQRTVGRWLQLHRKLHPELRRNKDGERSDTTTAHLPYRPEHLHHIWCTDIRELDTELEGEKVYSICVLEAWSRAILAGAVSFSKTTGAVLRVLYSAILNWGRPKMIVTDNEGQFRSHQWKRVVTSKRGLEVAHRPIEARKSYQNLIEAFFGIQARMTDEKFADIQTLEECQKLHSEFLEMYNATDHQGLREAGRDQTIPAVALGNWALEPMIEEDVNRIFNRVLFRRTTTKGGYARLQNWSFYVERGIPKRRIQIWVSEDELTAEYEGTTLASYECSFDPSDKEISELFDPELYETEFASPQMWLFPPEDIGWVKVQRLEPPDRSKHPPPEWSQPILYDVAL